MCPHADYRLQGYKPIYNIVNTVKFSTALSVGSTHDQVKNKMKVAITVFTLVLCVALAVGKPAGPQDIPKCLEGAWPDFETQDKACFKTITEYIVTEEVRYRHHSPT